MSWNKIFWFGMFGFFLILGAVSLIEKSRIFAVIIGICIVVSFILYRQEGDNGNSRNKHRRK